MKKTILILLVLAGSLCANAQVDTAAMRQYLLSNPSKTELIEKCRDRIFDAIIKNDRAKAEELMYYARTEFETDKYKVLAQDEMWLLAIWLRKYQLAVTEMVLDSLTVEQYQTQVNRFRYDLFPLLADSLHVNNDFYRRDIENDKSLTESRRDFLLLFIKIFDNLNSGNSVEIMNTASDEYLDRHPMSEHETFVRNLLRNKYKCIWPALDWGISVGAAFYSGDFGKYLDNGLAMNTYFGMSFANFVLNGEMGFLCGKLGDDVDFETAVAGSGGRTANMFLGVSAGYKIQLPHQIVATPTLGAGWVTLYPDAKTIKENEGLEDAKIKSAHAQPVIGVEVCREFPGNLTINPEGKLNQLIFMPTLRYTFMPVKFGSPKFNPNGSVHTVTIGVKYRFVKVKRDF
jgi:hypothetical protein